MRAAFLPTESWSKPAAFPLRAFAKGIRVVAPMMDTSAAKIGILARGW